MPGSKVDHDILIPGQQVRGAGTDLFHQLPVLVCPADAVQASQPGKDRLHVPRRQGSAVHPEPVHDPDPAARALLRHDRDTSAVQRFDIPVDRPAGYFKTLRQLRRGDLFPVQQHGKNGDQPIKFHSIIRLRLFLCSRPAFLLQHRVLLPFASNTARPALRVSITLKLPSS